MEKLANSRTARLIAKLERVKKGELILVCQRSQYPRQEGMVGIAAADGESLLERNGYTLPLEFPWTTAYEFYRNNGSPPHLEYYPGKETPIVETSTVHRGRWAERVDKEVCEEFRRLART